MVSMMQETVNPVRTLRLSPLSGERSTREEKGFAAEVEVWLRGQTLPQGCVLWYPRWVDSYAAEIAGGSQLALMIAGLDIGEFGGICRTIGDGRWAQVVCEQDGSKYLELHPYRHNRALLPFVWDSYADLTAGVAADRTWRWMQTTTP
jgi:hypothetical protein